jgi:hypothetical protein
MKCFLLLRNNVETGPFTLEELTAQALQTTDLIWIENQSVTWNYPTEIKDLNAFVSTQNMYEKVPVVQDLVLTTSKGIFVALPPQDQASPDFKKEHASLKPVQIETLHKLDETLESTVPFLPPKTFSKPHALFWQIYVFAGLMIAAGLIEKIVEVYDKNATGNAITVALPVHNMEFQKPEPEDDLFQNALTTELVPVDTATLKPLIKATVKVNLKKLVQVDANDYQVGMHGGIKNLRLLVTNRSAFVLDKVKIELYYIKTNGDIFKTKNLVLKAVPAKSRKSLKVPSSERVVKVVCRITGIESQQHANNMVSL